MKATFLSLCLLTSLLSVSAENPTDGVSYEEITLSNGTTLKIENLWFFTPLLDKTNPLANDYTDYEKYDCYNYTFVTDKSLFITNTSDKSNRVPCLAKVNLTTGVCDTKLYSCVYDEGLDAETETYRWYSSNMDTAGNPFVVTKATNSTSLIRKLRISVLYPTESIDGNPIVRRYYNLNKDDNWNIYRLDVSGDLASGNFIVWANAAVGTTAGSAQKTTTVRWQYKNGEQVSRDVFDLAYSCMAIHEYNNGNILIDDASNISGFAYPTLCRIEDNALIPIGSIQTEKFTDANGSAANTFSLLGENYIVYQTASAQDNSQFTISQLANFPNELNISQDLWTLPGDGKSLSSIDGYGNFAGTGSEKATVRIITNENSDSATLYFMANRTGIAAYRITAQQNYSGIIDSEIVNTDANTTVNIYTPAGVCVATHTTIHSAKQTLNKGIYIAKSSTSRPYKFIVK
jgi:hypothetical protein